jgi:hypothetical protein
LILNNENNGCRSSNAESDDIISRDLCLSWSEVEQPNKRPNMTLKLRLKQSPSPVPLAFDALPSSPPPPSPSIALTGLPPPTLWLSARDMKIFGADPLKSTSEIGIVQCKDCAKPILRSSIAEHAGVLLSFFSLPHYLLRRELSDNCKKYDLEKNGSKGKGEDRKYSICNRIPGHG